MERIKRKPFQGITNIIRFNWHFYIIALLGITALIVTERFLPEQISLLIFTGIALAILSIILSLAASYYVYDCSDLYSLEWMNSIKLNSTSTLVNINAGFDETSYLLSGKFADSELIIFDFYDPLKHTEVSIERARKAYPAHPSTITIATTEVPLPQNSVDLIFIILAAHEIRNTEERIHFFKQLNLCLKQNGKIIVVEHLRDLPNFIVYNIGFFHFFSTKEWMNTFRSSELKTEAEIKITPFISAFILHKNGSTS